MAMKIIVGDSWRLGHNTLIEGARILLVLPALLVLAVLTIPIRLLRRRRP